MVGLLFSVLIPVYNSEKYLRESLDSVVNQTFRDFELIIVDDGSTDLSGIICDEYAKKYPEFVKVYHKENEGVLLTRRYALKKAKGEFIIHSDADDYVSLDMLKVIEQKIDEYKADMICFNYFRYTEGKDDFIATEVPFPSGTVFEGEGKQQLYNDHVLNYTFVCAGTFAAKRECFDIDYDYRPWDASQGEDVIQSFAILNSAKKIVYVDERLSYYRKNTGSMTLKVKKENYIDFIRCYAMTKKYLDRWNIPPEVRKQFYYLYMDKMYVLLRLLLKKSKEIKDTDLYEKTVSIMLKDKVFIDLCSNYIPNKEKASMKIRLLWMKNAVLKNNRKALNKLILISNLFG